MSEACRGEEKGSIEVNWIRLQPAPHLNLIAVSLSTAPEHQSNPNSTFAGVEKANLIPQGNKFSLSLSPFGATLSSRPRHILRSSPGESVAHYRIRRNMPINFSIACY
jgi:hypothetical protein